MKVAYYDPFQGVTSIFAAVKEEEFRVTKSSSDRHWDGLMIQTVAEL